MFVDEREQLKKLLILDDKTRIFLFNYLSLGFQNKSHQK